MGRQNLGSSASKSGASDANSSDDTFEMKFKSASNATVSDGAAANAPAASGKKMREPKRTKIFLRNLSEDTTSMDLEELFSDVGPIRRAFVITNKGERKCSGQGFVQFVMEADAAAAVRRYSGKPFKGNRVLIELAKPRVRDETTKKSQTKPAVKHESDEDDVAVVKDEGYDITKEEEIGKAEAAKAVVPAKPAPAPAKKKPVPAPPAKREPPPKVEKKVVIISGLPAAKANTAPLEKVMRKYGPLVGLSFPLGPDNAAIVHAEFKEAKSAERAAKKCVDVAVGQHKISAQFRPEKRDGRLIIRNLPFNATEVDLCEKFGPHGHLVDVVLAKNKETGRLRGFGFVEFATKEEAAAALAKLNAQPIRGRPVAVDWCLTRETYLKHVIEEEIKSKTGKNAEEKEKAKTSTAQKAAVKQEIKVEEDDEDDEKEEQEVSDDDDDDDGEEDSGSGDDDEEDDDDEDDMDESDDEDDDEDGEEADEMDHDELVEVKIEKEDDDDQIIPIKSEADADASGEAKPKRQAEAVQAGSTLFIRNLPFGATVADLRSKFASFGRIRYCALVKDKSTGMPRGSAFLQFVQKSSADAVLAQVALFTSQFTATAGEADADSDAETTTTTPTPSTTTTTSSSSSSSSSAPKAVLAAAGRSGIFMEGRELQIDRAVDKDTAQTQFTLASKKESEERDKRNLYLATEGYITPEMGLKMGLSKLELARREEAMRAKKQKLKNPNFFVSKTRLSVRNLPKSVTDKQLKQLFTDAVLSSTAASAEDFQKANVRIKQAKIVMGDNERSKGFGFVEFDEHDHALIALREMNNSPKPFGEKRRLLVEFALEDRRVVESRKKRLQTQQVKLKKQREIEELESGGRPSKAKQQQQKNAKNADKPKPKKQDGAEANNKQAGQKRKREDNNSNGADKNNKNNNKNAGKPNKKEQQVKKQKVAADEQQQQRRPQPQQPKRGREEAESTKLSRKQRAAAKKRKDVDALDTLVNQYKERLFAPVVAKEATKRWFE